jgi:hypothetical protein
VSLQTTQVTTSATSASPLAQGVQGPVVVANHDATNAVFIGPKTVTASGATGGLRVAPGQVVTLPPIWDDLWGIAAAGTPVVSVAVVR